ncbi:hypothetical protein [Flavobacterium sp.]|uniref:hypothetical protein n=1 Tax=Flavobacterium sp. TaxID=239 RepID=UPI0037539103
MDRLNLTLSILLLFLFQNIFAQEHINQLVKENVYVNTNSSTLLTGEKLYYAVTCLNTIKATLSEYSKIAYVELINNDKQIVFKNKLFLKNSKGNSEYFIPTTLKTGKYKLLAYTNWMLNSTPIKVNSIDINIINPYRAFEEQNFPQLESGEKNDLNIRNLNSIYEIDKRKYTTREKIKLKLNESKDIDNQSSYTLKVFKKDTITSFFNQNESLSTINNTIIISKKTNTFITPEFRGEIIKGKIKAKSSDEINLKNISIALSITGNNSFFKIIQSNNNGEFCFTIEKRFKNEDLKFQIIDEDHSKYNLEIEDSNYLDYSNLKFGNLILTPNLKKSLERRSIASQIENAYFKTKNDSLNNNDIAEISSLKFDLVFNLNDYTRFQTMKETLTEIIGGAYYKSVDKKNEIHIIDNISEYKLTYPALVLIDGLYIQDVNEIFNYNIDNVETISITRGGYYYGYKIYNGVIFIKTKKNDYEPANKNSYLIEPKTIRPQQEKEYFNIDYTKKDYSRIPDYRHQLIWIPDLKADNKEISFYTSDISGVFEIVLEGIDSKGNKNIFYDSFEVE